MSVKISKIMLAVCISLLSAQTFAASAIFYPKPGGVICDKKSGFCADNQGISIAITQMELGANAAKKLMDTINKVGLANFDATSFTMSNGLHCEIKEKKCITSKTTGRVDAKATTVLFGK